MSGRKYIARRCRLDIQHYVAGSEVAGGRRWTSRQRSCSATAHVGLDFIAVRSDGRRSALLVFQCPLLNRAVNLAEVVDARIFLRFGACPDEVRNRDGGQQTDNGDHNHDFNQREPGLTICCYLHIVTFIILAA